MEIKNRYRRNLKSWLIDQDSRIHAGHKLVSSDDPGTPGHAYIGFYDETLNEWVKIRLANVVKGFEGLNPVLVRKMKTPKGRQGLAAGEVWE